MKKTSVIILVLFALLTIGAFAYFQVNAQTVTLLAAGKLQNSWVAVTPKTELQWSKAPKLLLTYFTATISPTATGTDETNTYVIQIVNLQKTRHSYFGDDLKCANITIPFRFFKCYCNKCYTL